MSAADLHPDTSEPRPGTCCGVCPPIAGGGWDCTCPGLPGCPVTATDDARAEAVRIIDSSVPDDVPGYRIRYAEKAADALIERGLLAAGRAETTTATDEAKTVIVQAATVITANTDEPMWSAVVIAKELATAGLLASVRTATTETEWGVRSPSGGVTPWGHREISARRHANESGHALVRREVTAWMEVD